MALLTQEAQGHMHCMNSGLQRGNWPCPLHVLEAAQPTPFPSSAEVTLEQSEPPWASGSHLQGQLWVPPPPQKASVVTGLFSRQQTLCLRTSLRLHPSPYVSELFS